MRRGAQNSTSEDLGSLADLEGEVIAWVYDTHLLVGSGARIETGLLRRKFQVRGVQSLQLKNRQTNLVVRIGYLSREIVLVDKHRRAEGSQADNIRKQLAQSQVAELPRTK